MPALPILPKKDDKAPARTITLEDRGRAYAAKAVACRRLAAAVAELVKNPMADLRPARRATELLSERYDQALTVELVKLLKAGPQPVRERAVTIAAQMTDPALIDPLVASLAGKGAVNGAAAALKNITGQELGPDPELWKQWLKDNRKNLQDAHSTRKRELAGSQIFVAVISQKKEYHAYDGGPRCLELNRASFNTGYEGMPLTDARAKGLQPCAKCKPTR